jgi:hypothetical protein
LDITTLVAPCLNILWGYWKIVPYMGTHKKVGQVDNVDLTLQCIAIHTSVTFADVDYIGNHFCDYEWAVSSWFELFIKVRDG